MKVQKTSGLFIVLSLFLVSACGKDGTVDKATSNLQHAGIMHTWEKEPCSSSSIFGASYRLKYEFSATEVKKIEEYFSAADCQNIAGTIVYNGTYKVKDEVQKDVHQLDMSFNTVQVTALNPTGQNLLNTVNFCSNNNWGLNVPVDLTAHTRDTLCPLRNLPEMVYDIYAIEGQKLFFGADGDKGAPEKRPVQIDRGAAFHQL